MSRHLKSEHDNMNCHLVKQKHDIRTNWILVFHHIVSHNLYKDEPQYYQMIMIAMLLFIALAVLLCKV